MVKYSVSEKNIRYKILLFSKNTQLINAFITEFNKRNIDIIVDRQDSQGDIKTSQIYNKGEFLITVYDLTEYGLSAENVVKQIGSISKKTVFIVKGVNINSSFSKKYLHGSNIVISMKDLSKYSFIKTSDKIFEHLCGKNSEHLLTFKKNSTKTRRWKRIYTAITLMLTFLLTPHLLMFLMLGTSLLKSRGFIKNMRLSYLNQLCLLDNGVNKYLTPVILKYNQVPLIGVFYTIPNRILYKSSGESDGFCRSVSDIVSINSLSSDVIYGRTVSYDTGSDIVGNKFLTSQGVENSYIKAVKPLYGFVKKFLAEKSERYFIVILQDDSVLTPTGGKIDELFLYYVNNGTVINKDRITSDDLKDKFKGNVRGSEIIYSLNEYSDYDRAADVEEKYKILKTTIQEIYQINISGMITVESNSSDNISKILHFFQKGTKTYKNSVDTYELLLKLINGKNIYIYFPNNSVFGNNQSFPNANILTERCFNNNFAFLEVGKDANVVKGANVKIVGNIINGGFSVNVIYSKNMITNLSRLIIKSLNLIKSTLTGSRNLSQEKYVSTNYSFLITNFLSESVNENVAQYVIPTSGCENGYGLKIEKQQGNDTQFISYDFNLDEPYYFYVNGSLTGRGNKSYNSESVRLEKDTSFVFIK